MTPGTVAYLAWWFNDLVEKGLGEEPVWVDLIYGRHPIRDEEFGLDPEDGVFIAPGR